jgi:hypothetical protein
LIGIAVDGAVGFGRFIELQYFAAQLRGALDRLQEKGFLWSEGTVRGEAQRDFRAGIPEADAEWFSFFIEHLHEVTGFAIGGNITDHATPDVRVIREVLELDCFHDGTMAD